MSAALRVRKLLPEAREASRRSPIPASVSPLITHLWQEMPVDKPVCIRCAWLERELMRQTPLGLCPDELLAGRVDFRAEAPQPVEAGIPSDMFPMGQRGHTALDAEKLMKLGITGIEAEIEELLCRTNDEDSRTFYKSALISLEGFRELAERLRVMSGDLSETAPEATQRADMARLRDVLATVPEHPATSFYEAIQATHLLYFAASLVSQSLYGPGRLDRVLRPYYEADIRDGRITPDGALELICCQFLLMNHAFETPQPVMLAGLGPDGRDTTSDLTYLCLEADQLVGLVNPSIAVAVNLDTPRELLDLSAERLLAGATKPSLFNDNVVISGLQQLGVPFEDAVEYIHSTCVEITMIGRSNILVASPYINLLRPLEFMLNAGRPMRGDENKNDVNGHTDLAPPSLQSYANFQAFLTEYERQLAGRIKYAAEAMACIRRGRAAGWAFPFASCFTADCLESGRDMDRGGARYTWTETSNVGLANIVDSLNVIKKRVFEEGTLSLSELREMLAADFPDEAQRRELIKDVPRYGNDIAEADNLAAEIVRTIYSEHYDYRDGLGGWFVPGFFCWIMHRVLGEQTAASPDGRRAGDVLADAAGAAQGRDTSGPTAAVRSITSWDHRSGLGGIVLNLRFAAGAGAEHPTTLVDLIRTYFELGGFEIQINAVDSEVLLDAQRDPESHADLLVRVAGYSDYFTLLDPKMQDEVISRTQHPI